MYKLSSRELKNEQNWFGIEEPVMIEDVEVWVQTHSKMDQSAFNATLQSDPGESKTFREAMDEKNKL